ncbi:MAG: ankyrin repeat domain-containing protein [Puniceicoccales bacterium]|jgi:ankyrin repeat protein|nr:ankyrin repeat domain-containing protein [Puniceicoccales bacterium]
MNKLDKKSMIKYMVVGSYFLGANYLLGSEEFRDDWFFQAAKKGDCECVVRNMSDKNVKNWDNNGKTALHYAAKNGHKNVVQFLLDNGADVNAGAKGGLNEGRTALHYAAENGHKKVVRFLLDNGADEKIKDGQGKTALHYAAEGGQFDIVTFLVLRNNIPVNARDNQGRTPLHYAAENGHKNVVRFLLDNGADVNTRTNNIPGLVLASMAPIYTGQTPIDLVFQNKKGLKDEVVKDLVALLRANGGKTNEERNKEDTASYFERLRDFFPGGFFWR